MMDGLLSTTRGFRKLLLASLLLQRLVSQRQKHDALDDIPEKTVINA